MAWTANQGQYITSLLQALGDPNTSANRRFLSAWGQAEGGGATYNPFNTTYGTGTAYNSNGGDPVKNYGSFQQGLHSTIATLKGGQYGGILSALAQGNNAMGAAQALAASPWGTGSLVEKILAGGGAIPPPAPTTSPGQHPLLTAGGGGGGREALIRKVMANNTAYALTGSLAQASPMAGASLKASIMQNGLSASDQQAMGNISPGGGTVPGHAGSIIQTALKFQGVPYAWGGESPKGFDCSGLIQYVYAQHGIHLGRTTYQQINEGTKVGLNQLRPGDLVFSNFGGGKSPEHVVMYIGNGKVIAAPHTGSNVQIQPLSYFTNYFVGARRIIH